MRLSSAASLLVAASSAYALQEQQVLGNPLEHNADIHLDANAWSAPLRALWGDFSEDAKATWEELSLLAPQALEAFMQSLKQSPPSKATRKPASYWDHISHGTDLASLRTTDANGQSHRKISGDLENYTLRTRSVDPSKLGVDKVKQYSGYLDDNEQDKHLFYWFFESRNDPKNDPVILWLNGGPGCSSMVGLLMELGPSVINNSGKLVYNINAWNQNASVIFIDQPVNSGFSYSSGTVNTTAAAGKDIYAMLSLFFHQFPEYGTQDFHISAESYGGHYAPVFASEILSHKNRNINLKSITVGNGWTDPYTQYAYYKPMACGDGGYPAVLDKKVCKSMEKALPRCQSLIKKCHDSGDSSDCSTATFYCNSQLIYSYEPSGMNLYDVRSMCEDKENLCYTVMKHVTEWLNTAEVREALGSEVDEFATCNLPLEDQFMRNGDWLRQVHHVVPGLLEEIPVLIYAGDADFIANWLANRAWVERLEWPGQKKYNAAKTKKLRLGGDKKGKHYGNVKSHGNLTFIQIFEAGHMAPYDQPEASLDMLNRWINGEWSAKAE